nr:MAG TPA: bifunctional protein PutA [Caudoviricetes sp.]
MSERMDTVSLALPKWVNEYYEDAHWEVRMKKSALMREVLLGYAKAKIAERAEVGHPSPGPFEDSDTEES